jgi:carbonic anhydrase
MKSRTSSYLFIVIGLLFVLGVLGVSGAQRRTGKKVKPKPTPQAKVDCAESNEGVDAATALDRLVRGNIRWQNSEMEERNWPQERQRTRCEQHPFAVVVSCMDSRVPPELIFDENLGEIFVIRVAGPVLGSSDVLGNDQLASLEYALINVGVRLVVVLGHTDCGAIKGAVGRVPNSRPSAPPYLPGLLWKLEPAIMDVSRTFNNGVRITPSDKMNMDRVAFVNARRLRGEIAARPDFRNLPGLQVKFGLYYTGSGKVAIDPTDLEQGYQACPPSQCK